MQKGPPVVGSDRTHPAASQPNEPEEVPCLHLEPTIVDELPTLWAATDPDPRPRLLRGDLVPTGHRVLLGRRRQAGKEARPRFGDAVTSGWPPVRSSTWSKRPSTPSTRSSPST